MAINDNDPLQYYARQGLVTDPGEHSGLFDDLPAEIPALCRVVRGILLHVHWAEAYGVKLTEEREQQTTIRPVAGKLAQIMELDDRPLTTTREPEDRAGSICRDYATILCAMLRHRGVPARARCGFGTYFHPGVNDDHWVCEYWRADEQRWVMVDAQLDELQRKTHSMGFDPSDMPPGKFLTGGRAWLMCRKGQADPDTFGIFDMHGMWFIQGNLVRDLLALNKIELMPWDPWGLMRQQGEDISPEDTELLDRIATLTLAGNEAFPEVRSNYENDSRLRAPDGWNP